MDQDTYDRGREITGPLQDLVTEYCWGAVWGRDGLPRKTRSMLSGALTNGVTRDEIQD